MNVVKAILKWAYKASDLLEPPLHRYPGDLNNTSMNESVVYIFYVYFDDLIYIWHVY